jgi:dTDP-L-rhamnose 4-epimerase
VAHVLITGGAGFIGSHLADALIERGDQVRVLDVLDPQVHGTEGPPAYLHPDVDLQVGDVRDAAAVQAALDGVDLVFHFAARVGVGQSMYEVERYTSVNNVGTAVLLEALARKPVERLIVASSMSVYGEGLYRRPDGQMRVVSGRSLDQLKRGEWDPRDADGAPLEPIPTSEDKVPALESVYALSKYDQERLCLVVGRAYGIPTVALRFFNVYGTRQALATPHTGVLATFASRLLNGRPPVIFEDGRQQRDFVHVRDVVQACLLAAASAGADGQVFNVGSGAMVTVRQVAARVADALGLQVEPEITGQYRAGDVRHCVADIQRAADVLGYRPRVPMADGVAELAEWLREQRPADRVAEMRAALAARGLTA